MKKIIYLISFFLLMFTNSCTNENDATITPNQIDSVLHTKTVMPEQRIGGGGGDNPTGGSDCPICGHTPSTLKAYINLIVGQKYNISITAPKILSDRPPYSVIYYNNNNISSIYFKEKGQYTLNLTTYSIAGYQSNGDTHDTLVPVYCPDVSYMYQFTVTLSSPFDD